MITDHAPPQIAVESQHLVSWVAVLAVVVGAMVLVGWTYDIATLTSVMPGLVAMKANTALCFILTGISLLLIAHPLVTLKPQNLTWFFCIARLCGFLVGLIGLLTLCEYIFNWNPGIDQWLFSEPVGTVGTSYPGRMAPDSALSFFMLAVALWFASDLHKRCWSILTSISFCLLTIALALSSMLSYFTPTLGTYGWFGLTIMAMNTAIVFAVLGVASIAICWQQDVLPWSIDRNSTAAMACGMAILVLIGFNTSRINFWTQETNRQITYSEVALSDFSDLLITVVDAQVHLRSYVITDDERFKASYLEAVAEAKEKLSALNQSFPAIPHQQQLHAKIENAIQLELQWFHQVIDSERNSMTDTVRNKMFVHGEELLADLRIKYERDKSEHQLHINQLKLEAENVSRLSYLFTFIGTFTSLLIFLSVIFKLNFVFSERKQAMNSLRNLSQAVEQSSNAIAIADLHADLEYVNEAYVKVTGYSRAELVGQNPRLLQSGKTTPATYADMWEHLTRGEGWKGELINRRKDNSEFISSMLISPVRQENGMVSHYLSVMEDITQLRQAQDALRASEMEFRSLAEAMPQIVWIARPDGKVIYFNQQWMDYTGLTLEESLGHGWSKPFHPDGQQRETDAWLQAMKMGTSYSAECRLRRADGVYRWWLIRGVPLQDAGGNILKWFGTFTDIHDLKMAGLKISSANAELRESERRFSDLLENVELISMMLDREARIIYCNDYLLRLTGWRRKEIIGENWFDIFVPPELNYLKDSFFGTLLANRPEARHHENEILTRSGERLIIRWNNSVLRSATGDVSGTASIGEDITDRRRAVEEIEFKNTILQTQQEASLDAILVVNENGKIISFNQQFIALWHLTPQMESEGSDASALQAVSEQVENPEAFASRIQYLYEHREEKSNEEIRLKDGRIIDRYSAPVSGVNGKYYGRAWYFRNITERKRMEETIKNMAAKFHTVFELSSDAIMLLDEKGIFDCNEATLRMFGYPTRADFINKHPVELSPPTQPNGKDSLNLANEHIAKAVNSGNNLFEWIHRRFDGTDFPTEVLLTSLELDGKQVLQATVRDITKRKQAEEELNKQFDELRRWHNITTGREERILDLKHEVNELLAQAGHSPRYPSAEYQAQTEG